MRSDSIFQAGILKIGIDPLDRFSTFHPQPREKSEWKEEINPIFANLRASKNDFASRIMIHALSLFPSRGVNICSGRD